MKIKSLLESPSSYAQFDLPCDVSFVSTAPDNDREDEDEIAGTLHICIGIDTKRDKTVVPFILSKSKTFINWLNEYLKLEVSGNFFKRQIRDNIKYELSSFDIVSIDTEYVIEKIAPMIVKFPPDDIYRKNLDIFFTFRFENILDFFDKLGNFPAAKQLEKRYFEDINDYVELPW